MRRLLHGRYLRGCQIDCYVTASPGSLLANIEKLSLLCEEISVIDSGFQAEFSEPLLAETIYAICAIRDMRILLLDVSWAWKV